MHETLEQQFAQQRFANDYQLWSRLVMPPVVSRSPNAISPMFSSDTRLPIPGQTIRRQKPCSRL
ncbi:MAG: hypothetical protein ABGX16_11425 [Pirellulales bacterium]